MVFRHNNRNNFNNSYKFFLTVFRVPYAIFGRNLTPIGVYSSSQRFFKVDSEKITSMASKG
jgi:hypothetical protein